MKPLEKVPTHKTAIILIGGGMRSSYSAGFLSALANQLQLPKPDIMIGSSADAANVLYFCTGQFQSFKRIWQHLLSTPKFISPLRFFKIMDVDYLIDHVFKIQEPLQIANLPTSSINWFIALTDIDHGEVRYIHKQETVDPFELLRAAKAIPVLYNRTVALSSPHGICRYFDGEFGATLTTHVEKAIAAGATKILILKNNSPWSWSRKWFMRLYIKVLPTVTRRLLLHDLESKEPLTPSARSHSHVTIKLCQARGPATTTTRSTPLLVETFQTGESDAMAMAEELRAFFSV